MRDWADAIPALKAGLEQHFPAAAAEEIEKWAIELFEQSSAANAVERVVRADVRPIADIDLLKGAVKNLRSAAAKLADVGWHGGKSLTEFSRETRRRIDELPALPLIGALDAGADLAEFLTAFADRLEAIGEEVIPNAPSVMSAVDEGAKRNLGPGAKTKMTAHETALVAHDAFVALAGKVPTVATKSGIAYGPFLDWVSTVFECLAIDASAETWARAVCKEKK